MYFKTVLLSLSLMPLTGLSDATYLNPFDNGAISLPSGTYGAITTTETYNGTTLSADFTANEVQVVQNSLQFKSHTVAFWLRPATVVSDTIIYRIFTDRGDDTLNEYNLQQTTGNQLKLLFENGNGNFTEASITTTGTVPTDGSWCHIAITIEESAGQIIGSILINGTVDTTSSNGLFQSGLNFVTEVADLTISNNLTIAGLYLDSTALSAAEVQTKATEIFELLPFLSIYDNTQTLIDTFTTGIDLSKVAIDPLNGFTGTNVTNTETLDFIGSGEGLNFGTAPSISGTADFTLSALIKTSQTPSAIGEVGGAALITQRDLGGNINGQLKLSMNENGQLVIWLYQNAFINLSPTAGQGIINDDLWHHIAFTRSGSTGTLYVDGTIVAQATTGFDVSLDNTNSFGIGADIKDQDEPFDGFLDEVSLFQKALSENEIKALYPTLTPTFGLTVEQIGSELFWQVEKEVGVKLYRIIDRQTGETLAEVPAGKTSYTYDLGAAKDVLLVVVDSTGFTQSFAPTAEDSVVLNLTAGWNLVSAPFATTADQFTNASVWAWHPETKAYQSIDSIPAQQAVWVFTAAADTLVLTGTIAPTTLELTAGWNLYGPSENCEAPAHLHIYDWQQNYQITDYLTVGNGYWIYAETAQSLLLP